MGMCSEKKKALNKEGLTLYRLVAPGGPHLGLPPCPVRQVGVGVSPTLDDVQILTQALSISYIKLKE
jgi:hypothetical protein